MPAFVTVVIPEKILIPRSMSPMFKKIRMEFGAAFYNIGQAIDKSLSSCIEDLKRFLRFCLPDIKPRLMNCTSIDEVLDVVYDQCTLIDISCLEEILKQFKIKDAESYIIAYNESIEDFSRSVAVHLCLKEKFQVASAPFPLKDETAKFVIDWDQDDIKTYTLKDISNILSVTFERELSKRVKIIVVEENNSITVTCTFPHSLARSLIAKAQEMVEIMKKKGVKGVTRLIIAHCIIYISHGRDEVYIIISNSLLLINGY